MKAQALSPRRIIDVQEINLAFLLKEMEDWSNRIAQRAYEYFAASGFTNGHDLDDWVKAERDLLKPVVLDVTDAGDRFIVTAEVPGYDVDDLDISINGSRLIIQGEHDFAKKKTGREQKTVSSERGPRQIYRVVELPAAVGIDPARAELKNGILELRLPKAEKPKQIAVAAA